MITCKHCGQEIRWVRIHPGAQAEEWQDQNGDFVCTAFEVPGPHEPLDQPPS